MYTDRGTRKGNFKRWPEALIVLQSLIYGFGDPISKIAFETVPVYSMSTVRYLIAFIACFAIFHKRVIKTVKEVPVRYWLVPGTCIGFAYLLNNVALSLTDATSVAFLRSLSVVATPLFAFLIYGKHYDKKHILLQILVLPGLYLLCVRGGLSGFGRGELVTLAGVAFAAGTLVFSRKYLDSVDPVELTALQALCSAALAFAGSIMAEGGIQLGSTTPKVWLIIIYLAIACTFFGYLLQNIALTRISARSVALLQTLCPVLTACFSFILLGEKLTAAGMLGALIIIICVAASTAAGGE